MSKIKKVLASLLVIAMLAGIGTSVMAEEIESVSLSDLKNLSAEMQTTFVDTNNGVSNSNINFTNNIGESVNRVKIDSDTNSLLNQRGTWRITDPIFNGNGQLTSSNTMDMYVLQTTSSTAPALKLVSNNPNLLVQLFILDPNTGNASSTAFVDQANDSVAQLAGYLAAGHYILAVGSASGTAAGAYTLMWNQSNPSNPTRALYASDNLDLVTLGYGYQVVRSNGNALIQQSKLKWEEEMTVELPYGHSGRSQSISDVNMSSVKLHYGSYSTNTYSTDNALFVQIGRGTLWSITRTYYSNISGDVIHEMNFDDATGQRTPRRLTEIDEQIADHYLVIDLEQNLIVDFFSPYNYLWQTGEITGGGTVYEWDI